MQIQKAVCILCKISKLKKQRAKKKGKGVPGRKERKIFIDSLISVFTANLCEVVTDVLVT